MGLLLLLLLLLLSLLHLHDTHLPQPCGHLDGLERVALVVVDQVEQQAEQRAPVLRAVVREEQIDGQLELHATQSMKRRREGVGL